MANQIQQLRRRGTATPTPVVAEQSQNPASQTPNALGTPGTAPVVDVNNPVVETITPQYKSKLQKMFGCDGNCDACGKCSAKEVKKLVDELEKLKAGTISRDEFSKLVDARTMSELAPDLRDIINEAAKGNLEAIDDTIKALNEHSVKLQIKEESQTNTTTTTTPSTPTATPQQEQQQQQANAANQQNQQDQSLQQRLQAEAVQRAATLTQEAQAAAEKAKQTPAGPVPEDPLKNNTARPDNSPAADKTQPFQTQRETALVNEQSRALSSQTPEPLRAVQEPLIARSNTEPVRAVQETLTTRSNSEPANLVARPAPQPDPLRFLQKDAIQPPPPDQSQRLSHTATLESVKPPAETVVQRNPSREEAQKVTELKPINELPKSPGEDVSEILARLRRERTQAVALEKEVQKVRKVEIVEPVAGNSNDRQAIRVEVQERANQIQVERIVNRAANPQAAQVVAEAIAQSIRQNQQLVARISAEKAAEFAIRADQLAQNATKEAMKALLRDITKAAGPDEAARLMREINARILSNQQQQHQENQQNQQNPEAQRRVVRSMDSAAATNQDRLNRLMERTVANNSSQDYARLAQILRTSELNTQNATRAANIQNLAQRAEEMARAMQAQRGAAQNAEAAREAQRNLLRDLVRTLGREDAMRVMRELNRMNQQADQANARNIRQMNYAQIQEQNNQRMMSRIVSNVNADQLARVAQMLRTSEILARRHGQEAMQKLSERMEQMARMLEQQRAGDRQLTERQMLRAMMREVQETLGRDAARVLRDMSRELANRRNNESLNARENQRLQVSSEASRIDRALQAMRQNSLIQMQNLPDALQRIIAIYMINQLAQYRTAQDLIAMIEEINAEWAARMKEMDIEMLLRAGIEAVDSDVSAAARTRRKRVTASGPLQEDIRDKKRRFNVRHKEAAGEGMTSGTKLGAQTKQQSQKAAGASPVAELIIARTESSGKPDEEDESAEKNRA